LNANITIGRNPGKRAKFFYIVIGKMKALQPRVELNGAQGGAAALKIIIDAGPGGGHPTDSLQG